MVFAEKLNLNPPSSGSSRCRTSSSSPSRPWWEVACSCCRRSLGRSSTTARGTCPASTPQHGWPTWCPHSLSYRVLYRNPSSRLRCLSGGAYLYIERTFGPLLGTMAGLGLWASFFLKSAFTGWLQRLSDRHGGTPRLGGSRRPAKLVATGLLVVITGINIRGLGLLKSPDTLLFIAVGCVLLLVGWAFLNGTVDRPTPPHRCRRGGR